MKTAEGGLFDGVLDASLVELRNTFVNLIPKLVTALLFLVLAYVAIRIALRAVRSALDRVYTGNQLIADLFATIVAVLFWFGALLTLLKILGMGDIAASLGTATGFVALGVSYALSDMIADTVAGIYLLKDPDFNPGDTVVVGDVTGVVRQIDLRKTRLEVEGGDTVVLGNSSVEEKWTRKSSKKKVAEEEVEDETASKDETTVEKESSSDESPSPSE